VANPSPQPTNSGNDGPSALGSATPRVHTPPLITGPPGPCGCGCALTVYTSYGFDVIDFAREVLGTPLDPWECFAAIHGGELLPDGRPRFRKLLIIVARQNGKTLLCQVLALYWLFIERLPLILGTSTNLGYAKRSWLAVVKLAERTPDLACDIINVRKAAGEECLESADPDDPDQISEYRIAAANRKGGRSLSTDRWIADELREHQDYSAWDAAYNSMSARPGAQVVAITNMGDASSVVLNDLRRSCHSFIETGKGDTRTGLLEWSAPLLSDPEDPAALAMANPNLGRRIDLDDLLADAKRVKASGGEALTGFKTEIMCIGVDLLNPAIDAVAWRGPCALPGDLAEARQRLVMCLDVSWDERHATLTTAALLPGGKVRGEVVESWSGPTCVRDLERDLPAWLKKVRPQKIGWFPNGPAAAVAAAMSKNKRWPPGVTVEALNGETTAVCMGFGALVTAGDFLHSNDPLLDAHVLGAEKLPRGDGWIFGRKDADACDAAYSIAGSAYLARTLPPPVGKPRLIVPE
jgi:hypothetical protein